MYIQEQSVSEHHIWCLCVVGVLAENDILKCRLEKHQNHEVLSHCPLVLPRKPTTLSGKKKKKKQTLCSSNNGELYEALQKEVIIAILKRRYPCWCSRSNSLEWDVLTGHRVIPTPAEREKLVKDVIRKLGFKNLNTKALNSVKGWFETKTCYLRSYFKSLGINTSLFTPSLFVFGLWNFWL